MSRCLDRRGCWIGVCVFCVIRENNLYPCCSLVPLFKCLHCILLRADHHRQHAARNSQVIPRHRPARNAHGARRLPRLSPVTDAACSQGNTYDTPGGTNSSDGSSYHYSNNGGSYYYANDNGSTYDQPAPESSAPPVYTPPPSK